MWWILIAIVLLQSRSKSAALSPQAHDIGASELVAAGLTDVGHGVLLPDQRRDTISQKLHAVSSIGPTITQQELTLLGMGSNLPDASFSLDNSRSGGSFANILVLNRSGVNYAADTGKAYAE